MPLPAAVFDRQMAMLAARRHEVPVLGLEEARQRLVDRSLERRAVVLTFDDGRDDSYTEALPILTRYELPATLYMPSDLVGAPGHLTKSQLVEMAAAGISIGAHSRTHPDLRTCRDTELDREVRGSRHELEDLLGRPVTSFAYPTGLFDDRVMNAVAAAGYRSAVSVRRGWLRPTSGRLQIPRNFVEDVDGRTFWAAVNGGLNWLAHIDRVRTRRASPR